MVEIKGPSIQGNKEPWYKGKDIITHKWVYGNKQGKNELFQDTKKSRKHNLVEPKSISRFSALRDINNKGVYEGDIIALIGEWGELYGVVRYAETTDGSTPKGFYVQAENGGLWKMNENTNLIKGPQGHCSTFEVYVHCYDHYGPDWNSDD